MSELTNKDLFKKIREEVRDYQNYVDDVIEMFPYFCLRILWDLPYREIDLAIEGLRTNDEGVDAFYVDDEAREINIIQFKAHESASSAKPPKKEWFSLFAGTVDKLENQEFINSHRNSAFRYIAKKYNEAREKGYETKLYFFHLGTNNKISHVEHHGITYYDIRDIKELYQEYLSKLDRTEPKEITVNLGTDGNIIEENPTDTHKTVVCIITGDVLIEWRRKHRYKLFDKNLRFAISRSSINKKISHSAKHAKKLFYFYNNGITITCRRIKKNKLGESSPKKGLTLKLESPQIINGAQTVNAIFDAWDSGNSDSIAEFKEIKVLCKIVEDRDKDGENITKFEQDVIRYNNTQNAIKMTDFFANSPEQISLQRIMATIGYFYEIKRGDRDFLNTSRRGEGHNLLKLDSGEMMTKRDFNHWDTKIDLQKLASVWMAYKINPSIEQIKPRNIFAGTPSSDENYRKIYVDDTDDLLYKAKEMVLAVNLFDLLEEQKRIYGTSKKFGDIEAKISSVTEEKRDGFDKVRDLIQSSAVFGTQLKNEFEDIERFLKRKNYRVKDVEGYQFFLKGVDLVLAVFKLIMDEVGYTDELVKRHSDKDYLKKVVYEWLYPVLRHVIRDKYEEFRDKNPTASLDAFYTRRETWKAVKQRFEELNVAEDKPYEEFFPLPKE